MALYKVALRMAHDNTWPRRGKWSTTFVLNVANAQAAAAAVAVGWEAHLKAAASQTVFAYEAYATSLQENDDDYAVVGIAPGQQRGTLAGGFWDGEKYDPDACVVITLPAVAGRPSRKFWRPGLTENAVLGGVDLQPVVANDVRAGFTAFVNAIGEALVDVDGQAITGVGRMRLGKRELGRLSGFQLPTAPSVG